MKNYNIEVNTNKQILSSETKIYKTESFFYQTKKLSKVEKFIQSLTKEELKELKEKIKNDE